MKKLILSFLFLCSLTLLSSCVILQPGEEYVIFDDDIFVFVDGNLYRGFDATIAYDFYNELYEADSINNQKPILFRLYLGKK